MTNRRVKVKESRKQVCVLTAVIMLGVFLLLSCAVDKAAFGETLLVNPVASFSYSDGFIANSIPRNGRAHLAQDYAASYGTKVVAIADGKVVDIFDAGDASGYNIIIEHNINGEIAWTRSCHHYKSQVKVKEGDTVTAGQVIAEVGNNGKINGKQVGSHLHFQIVTGKRPNWGGFKLGGDWPLGKEVNGPITYNGTTYWSPKRVIAGLDVIGDPTPVNTLSFVNIVYPETYKISSSGWNLSGGSVASDKELQTLFVKIYRKSDNTIISQMASARSISGKRFNIANLDGEGKDNGQKFSKITEAGEYIWAMTATDSAGRELYLEIPFTAVTNQSTVTAMVSSTNSTYSERPLSGVYQFNKNDDCRSGPGESYTEVRKLSKGDVVFVVASALSQYNYTWYKLSDGTFIYSGDVDKITLTETSMSGEYRFIRGDESRIWPYEDSTKVKSYSKGATITIKAKVVNTYNNTWYKLSDDSYVWSGDVEPASGVRELQFSGVKYPTNYKIGSSNGYLLSDGTLTSNYELKTITTTIKNSSGAAISGPKTRNISGYSYNIKNLDTLESGDNGVKFSKVTSAGQYIWVLTATDSGNNTLTMEMPFSASSSATLSGTMSKGLSDINKPVTSVTITIGEESGNSINATYYGYNEDTNLTLFAQVEPTNATNSIIKWTSSNEKVLKLNNSESMGEGGTIATFSKTGVGTAIITASAQDGSGKIATLTYNYNISSISLEAMDYAICVDQTTSIIPSIVPSVAGYQDITWESSSPWVATVDEYGCITGTGTGTTVITATARDSGAVKGTCTIRVLPVLVEDILFDVYDLTIPCGTSYTMDYEIIPYNAQNKNVVWSSSNTSVVTVEDGIIAAVGLGTATVYATAEDGNVSAKCEINVTSSGNACGDNLTWQIDGTKLTVSGTGPMYDYASSETTPWADYRSVLTELEFTEGVTSVGDSSFSWCSQLSQLTIPSTVKTIGTYAFMGCGSQSIIIPNGVTEIGAYAFAMSGNLTTLNLPESLKVIANGAFYDCDGIAAVKIPNSIELLGDDAFKDCASLKLVNIPSMAFVTGGNVFNDTDNIIVYCYDGSLIHGYAVAYGFTTRSLDSPLTNPDFVVPDALITIEEEGFSGISAKRVRLGENVTKIGSKAFSSCPNLVQIYIPEGCTYIASDAFSNVNGLIIVSQSDSYAELYAKDHGYSFFGPGALPSDMIRYYIQNGSQYYDAILDMDRNGIINSVDYILANKAGL